MAPLTFLPDHSEQGKQPSKRNRKLQKQKQKKPSSWDQIKNLLTCKQIEGSSVHDPSKNHNGYSKLGSSCSSICSFRDVVHGNTRVVHRADNSPESSTVGQETGLLSRKAVSGSSTRSLASSGRSKPGATYTSSSKGMQFRKLYGCYECHMIVDPSRYPSPRTTICACSQCGEVFPKAESLELHQKVRHADTVVNSIFFFFFFIHLPQLKTQNRINTEKSAHVFPILYDQLSKYMLSLTCALGARGSSNLCSSIPDCGVCTIIRHGFQGKECKGVRTTASSGVAHDSLIGCTDGQRAMLVCRVIAGRVKRVADDVPPPEEDAATSIVGTLYDSVAGCIGIYSNLEELFVFNPRAILPCFVVIYRVVEC
uniref:C2H2-type domain-containing protein n=1 Tax=Manihot esculenta TaxID=3983 RepID=A0A2C9U170_MANES